MNLEPASTKVAELVKEVNHLRKVVEFMGWNAIDLHQMFEGERPQELNNVVSAYIMEELRTEKRGTLQ
jgi:hypothetical protein